MKYKIFGVDIPKVDVFRVKDDDTWWCHHGYHKFGIRFYTKREPYYYDLFVYAKNIDEINIQKELDNLQFLLERYLGKRKGFLEYTRENGYEEAERIYSVFLRNKRLIERFQYLEDHLKDDKNEIKN